VIVEEQLLPRTELEPSYQKLVWLYVFRDFSGSEEDLAAERTCIRLGFTSYPQHWLLDPESLKRLRSTGRSLASFQAAANGVSVKAGESVAAVDAMRAAEKRASKLRKSRSVKEARKAIDETDLVLKYRALEVLAEKAPKEVVARAKTLLAVPNDPFRFLAMKVLGDAGMAEAAPALAALVDRPTDSLNPNVLRITAIRALGACGDATAVGTIRPHAITGDSRNGLTGVSIDALAAIAKRVKDARPAAKKALNEAWPKPPKEPGEARRVVGLAKRVHRALVAVTGRKVKFPAVYDAKGIVKLKEAFGR
jgi:hypothetical protein